ncbi:hypothetical protein DSO57_1028807 [Entomophthora muscae]|uniref:Uncharacterized protein n=1 Tax=Entomophthora muscae TaxID=34485 RepID=A0ACC2RG49_9FUNG|nr:hypothetical protein DSO57_1028807 [Entomophthora muscae]
MLLPIPQLLDSPLKLQGFYSSPALIGLKEIDVESELPPPSPTEHCSSYHLTKETLRGPRLIEAEYTGNLIKMLYLGSDLCGHKGIIHGGLIATILQEACREFTGNTDPSCNPTYSINYKAPVFADQSVTISAKEPVDSPQGLIITADLMDKDGKLLSNITAVFPKN